MLERQSFLKYESAYFSQILIYLTFSIQFQFYYVSTTLAEEVGHGIQNYYAYTTERGGGF